MRLERIRVCDVFPDDSNPRSNYKGLDELARSFEGGEPYNPLIVYRDGGIYICVDGNRRLQAMKNIATPNCWAYILEDQNKARDIQIQLATGTTIQPLDKVEQSRGYQTALAFDVPTRDIARLQGVTEERVESLRAVVEKVGDYAEDASLDRLYYLADNDLTEEQERAILTAPESDWRRVAGIKQSDKTNAERLAESALKLEALRQVVDEELWYVRTNLESEMFYICEDMDRWDEQAISVKAGKVEPGWSTGKPYILDPERFERWASMHGLARTKWVVDPEVLDRFQEKDGELYYNGERVEGVTPTVKVPNSIHLHPSKTVKDSIREGVRREYLR